MLCSRLVDATQWDVTFPDAGKLIDFCGRHSDWFEIHGGLIILRYTHRWRRARVRSVCLSHVLRFALCAVTPIRVCFHQARTRDGRHED